MHQCAYVCTISWPVPVPRFQHFRSPLDVLSPCSSFLFFLLILFLVFFKFFWLVVTCSCKVSSIFLVFFAHLTLKLLVTSRTPISEVKLSTLSASSCTRAPSYCSNRSRTSSDTFSKATSFESVVNLCFVFAKGTCLASSSAAG